MTPSPPPSPDTPIPPKRILLYASFTNNIKVCDAVCTIQYGELLQILLQGCMKCWHSSFAGEGSHDWGGGEAEG